MITIEPPQVIDDPTAPQSSAIAISQSFDFDRDPISTAMPSNSMFFPQISAGGQVLPPQLLARKYVGTKSSFFLPRSTTPAQLPEQTPRLNDVVTTRSSVNKN